MPIADAQVLDPNKITDLDDTRVVESLKWNGVTFELRDHVDDWLAITWSEPPVATAHPLMAEGRFSLHLAVAEAILEAATTRILWNDHNQAGVAVNNDGSCWTAAWIQAGQPHYSEHDDWNAAHLALADRLDEMAQSPVYTGSNIEDEIAQAHLHRAAADIRSAVALAKLGDVVRDAQPHLQKGRQVTAIAKNLGVERKFLYRVFAGEEWRRR
ncbi:hypothetical protein ACIO3O_37745 [Streptomyces sp. NPDC087440]|uniref:hypothetical protein n=1 Tax=Streptomyces sp. NPDC087440 TaxID=3365790 RepID=UPI00382270A3